MSTATSGLRALLWAMGTVILGATLSAAWWLHRPLDTGGKVAEVSIEPGTTPREAAQLWVAAGVRTAPELLFQWFRFSGQSRRIRAGSYALPLGSTPRELLARMVQGEELLLKTRLTEGWTWRQWRAELAKVEGLKPRSQGLQEPALLAALGLDAKAPEGRFLPDTYVFGKGVSDLTVMQRARAAMDRQLDAAWAQRAPDSPLKSKEELLVLASLVEKETGVAADRPLVAAVFHNRLRIGMPMQSDPTVIYGLGEAFDGNLRKRDLQRDTAFNTYTRRGLPPTPICMPGAASLLAAARPAASDALYFVARGDGSSQFSRTLAEHNAAVNRYQRKAAR